MSKKRIILSDSSLNRYGYRVLTEGMNIEAFKKNPVMLYMHFRDEGSPYWGESKAIGHWEDIQIEGDVLSAIPVFDMVDELSQTIAKKYEAGTYNAASVGIRVIATSANKDLLIPGQTRETVTESELMEASIVDVPANSNAVRLYEKNSKSVFLAADKDNNVVPDIKLKNDVMNLKKTWKTVLAFLKVTEENAETTVLSADNIESLNAEMERLSTENNSLKEAKEQVDEQVTTLKSEVSTKDSEINTLKTSVESKNAEITQLKQQVTNLKGNPAGDGKGLKPDHEPGAEDGEDSLAAYCKGFKGDTLDMADKLKQEGLI